MNLYDDGEFSRTRCRSSELLRGAGNSFKLGGLVVPKPSHADIAALHRRGIAPAELARKNWGGSYLLVDYLQRRRLRSGQRVLEVGCGWGLAATYLARWQKADVEASDIDVKVFPFLRAQARLNDVVLKTRHDSFAGLCKESLPHQLLIGADICYSASVSRDLGRLIRHALDSGVAAILIADVGRRSFYGLCEQLARNCCTDLSSIAVRRPAILQGHILLVTNPGKTSPWLPAVAARF